MLEGKSFLLNQEKEKMIEEKIRNLMNRKNISYHQAKELVLKSQTTLF